MSPQHLALHLVRIIAILAALALGVGGCGQAPEFCRPPEPERLALGQQWLAEHGYEVDISGWTATYFSPGTPICGGQPALGCSHFITHDDVVAQTMEILWNEDPEIGATEGMPVVVHELLHVYLWQTHPELPPETRSDPKHLHKELFGFHIDSVVDAARWAWSGCRDYSY